MIEDELSPLDHVYVKFPVPPTLEIVAVPSNKPKQDVGVELNCEIISSFSVTSTESVTLQPLESVTSTEYIPDGICPALALTCPLLH